MKPNMFRMAAVGLLISATGCNGADNAETRQEDGFWALRPSGQTEWVEAANVCAHTVQKLPPGVQVMPDPLNKSFRFVSLASLHDGKTGEELGGGGGGTTITCNCTAGNGSCTPWVSGEDYGCAFAAPCTRCEMTTGKTKIEPIQVPHPGGPSMGAVSVDVRRPLQSESCSAPSAETLSVLLSALKTLTGTDAPVVEEAGREGLGHIILSYRGEWAMAVVQIDRLPVKLRPLAQPLPTSEWGGNYSCRCDRATQGGAGKCEYHSLPIKYCEADGCAQCTMTGPIKIDP